MNFSFWQNDPLRSIIVDDESKEPIYEVASTSKSGALKTTLRHVQELPSGDIVPLNVTGEVFWSRWRTTMVVIAGESMVLPELLHKETGLMAGLSHIFTGPDGRRYKWKQGAHGALVMKDCATKSIIAQCHPVKTASFSSRVLRDMSLEVTVGGMHMLDWVILTFIIMEHRRRAVRMESGANAPWTPNAYLSGVVSVPITVGGIDC